MIPIFYRKSAKTTVVIAPMSAVDALRPLGPWLAWRQDDVAILLQGQSDWDLIPWTFQHAPRPAALLSENRCWQCLVSDECNANGGPPERIPELVQVGRKPDWSDDLANSIEIGFLRNCITNPHAPSLEVPRRPKLMAGLEAAGFRLVKSIGHLADGGLVPYAKGPAPLSLHENRGRWYRRSEQAKMVFDDGQVLRNIAAATEKGEHAQREKTRLKVFRDAECSKCVYKCERPPWSWEAKDFIAPCHMAIDAVETGYTGSDDQKMWIANHSLAGRKMKARGDNAYVDAAGIGAWPDENDPKVMVIRRRSVGGSRLTLMPVDEYVQRSGSHMVQSEDELVAEHVTDDGAALTYWALKRMHEHCRHHARFWNGDRFVYNDTFFIRAERSRHIVIGSDSRAGHHGGYGARGSTITVDERPRFRTNYEHPYFKNIQHLLGITPGARRR